MIKYKNALCPKDKRFCYTSPKPTFFFVVNIKEIHYKLELIQDLIILLHDRLAHLQKHSKCYEQTLHSLVYI